jgi:hypothetical protein
MCGRAADTNNSAHSGETSIGWGKSTRKQQKEGKTPHRVALLLWGARVVCVRDILILNDIWRLGKIYILVATLVAEIFYLSLSTDTGSEM